MITPTNQQAAQTSLPSSDLASQTTTVEREWDAVFTDAVEVFTRAARRRRSRGADAADTGTERVDFAEFASLVLAATAANVGGVEELLAGRSGSWEAGHLRDLLTSTVGSDEEYLWGHRTEPVVIAVAVDQVLTELGISDLYDDSARVVWALQEAVSEDLCDSEADAEYDRLAHLEDSLETLRESEWVAYGDAFTAAVLAELEREPIPGLRVPVVFDIDARPWQDTAADWQPGGGPMARLYEAGWANTPLPGSGVPPRDYPSWGEITRTERTAGRLPHLRIPSTTTGAADAADDRTDDRTDDQTDGQTGDRTDGQPDDRTGKRSGAASDGVGGESR